MPRVTGAVIRGWRRSMGWDVPAMARQLRKAAGHDSVPDHDVLVRQIRRWERKNSGVSERYELLYLKAIEAGSVTAGSSVADPDWSRAARQDGHARALDVLSTSVPSVAGMASDSPTGRTLSSDDLRSALAGVTDGDELLDLTEKAVGGHQGVIAAGQMRVDERQVALIEAATTVFRQWDNEFGGGLIRKAVVAQLRGAGMLLDGPFKDEQTRRRWLLAVTDLAQLAGWMSYDLQMHRTAQRYYFLGLRTAREAGDGTQVARLLYCLARQMVDVGRHKDALDFARAGLYAARRNSAPKPTALLNVIEARAYACMGDVVECRRALGTCQETFRRVGAGIDPHWCAFFDEGELCGLVGVTLRDLALADTDHARRHAADALPWVQRAASQRPSGFLRSKVLDLDGLAVIELLLHEPAEAAKRLMSAVSMADGIASERVSSRLRRTVALGNQLFPGSRALGEAANEVGIRTAVTGDVGGWRNAMEGSL